MKKEILLAAALSAALHLGLIFGFGTSEKAEDVTVVELTDESIEHEQKKDEPPPDPNGGDEQQQEVAELLPAELLSPGLNERVQTSVSMDALAQVVRPEAYHEVNLDKLSLGIPTGNQHVASKDAKAAIVFSVDQLDRKPEPRYMAKPNYPYEMRAAGVEGDVVLLIIVDPTGRVTSVDVLSSTNVGFEKNAVEAARKWRFEKGLRNGVAVTFKCNLPIHFSSPK